MTTKILVIFISLLTFGCKKTDVESIIEYKIDKSMGSPFSLKIIKTIRKFDKKTLVELKQVSNLNNNRLILKNTGIKKEDGFKDAEVDSLFYDSFGRDTLKYQYACNNGQWTKRIITIHKYRPDNQIQFFNIKHLYIGGDRKIFSWYDNNNHLIKELQVESIDTVSKKIYNYSKNHLDSTSNFYYKNKAWTYIK